jgi:hypothetical protein
MALDAFLRPFAPFSYVQPDPKFPIPTGVYRVSVKSPLVFHQIRCYFTRAMNVHYSILQTLSFIVTQLHW